MVYSKEGLAILGASLSVVIASVEGFEPLINKKFKYSDIPYKVDTDVGLARGTQPGYNICNSTTEGPKSFCQTAFMNSLDDFCLWAPSIPGHPVGDIEGEMIAWCTKGGHGMRIMPPGTITGVQFTKMPDYIQVVGFMDQTKINMVAGDSGGEMDPHGADLRGNPMGGLLFTNAWTGSYIQANEWHNFNGNNRFCLKACDPSGPRPARYCEHIFDIMGCGFNAPSNAADRVFESCASESQDSPGEYVNSTGKTVTWRQGDGTVPYSVRVPKSTSCSQFKSADIFEGGVSVPVPGASGSATVTSQGASSTSASVSSTSVESGVSSTATGVAAGSGTSGTVSITGSVTTQGTFPQSSSGSDSVSSNGVVGRKMGTGLALLGVTLSFCIFV